MITPNDSTEKFSEFISKEKFVAEGLYPGLADEKLKPILTEKINGIAISFSKISKEKEPNDKKYQNAIKKGLTEIYDIQLDTEDREMYCTYIEQIMDIVNLESSNGLLNKFMYGFDLN